MDPADTLRDLARAGEQPVHVALFYASVPEFLDGLVPFLADGVHAGEPVLVSEPPRTVALLRRHLLQDAPWVQFLDMTEVARTSDSHIHDLLGRFLDEHAMDPCRIVCEPIWPGCSADARSRVLQNEALCNLAYAGRRATIVCPYDVSQVEADDIRTALWTHPVILSASGLSRSPDYSEPLARAASMLRHVPAWTGDGVELRIADDGDFPLARAFVTLCAARSTISPDRSDALGAVVDEVVRDALRRAAGRCAIRAQPQSAGLLVEVAEGCPAEDEQLGRRVAGRRTAAAYRRAQATDSTCVPAPVRPRSSGTVIRLLVRTS